jgi:hypothetical protein
MGGRAVTIALSPDGTRVVVSDDGRSRSAATTTG